MVETYTALREFADSWALLALTVIFIGIVAYTFRPSSKRLHRDSAEIPFRNEETPVDDSAQKRSKTEREV